MPEKKKSGIYKKLMELQKEIKVAKQRYNKFGGFYYRSLEDIFEALKPMLEKHGLSLVVSDSIALAEPLNRVYIKANATLIDVDTGDTITATGFAREADMKKGMDSAQLTGATSSYARKYALAGLLLLDDNKDIDEEDTPQHEPQKTPPQKPPQPSSGEFNKEEFLKQVQKVIEQKKLPDDVVNAFLQTNGLSSFEEINDKQTAIDIFISLKKITVKQINKKEESNEKKGNKNRQKKVL